MKTLKAEMWDKMQFLFRNYYDRMVHAVFYYGEKLDEKALTNVLVCLTEKATVLHSRFVENPVDPFWEVSDYTIADILTVKNVAAAEVEGEIDAFITQCIPVKSNVQYKVLLLNDENRSILCFIINHMCCDGGDLKYFIGKIAENYAKVTKGESPLDIKTGSRSYDAVYSKLSEEDKKTAKGLYKNISQVKDTHYFPFTPDSPEDRTRIVRRRIDADTFATFKSIGKKLGVTVNDLLLAVYVRTLYEVGKFNENEPLSIPCMVDLRRHIVGGGSETGLTNHTGFMLATVPDKGETINDTLINVIRSVKKSKNDKFMGLYSLPLLKLAYTVFPHAISEIAIKIGYLNPLIGMSNIGLLDEKKFAFGTAKPVDGFMTGAVKYKPYMQLACTTMHGRVTMTICSRCNDRDEKIINDFFDALLANVEMFIDKNAFHLEETQN